MLIIANSLRELRFSALMEVYAEGNRENGEDLYPHLPPREQILQAEQDFYAYLRTGFFTQSGDVYCIWEEDGRYCSALRLQRYQDGLLLEALETAPADRRQGYARKLMEAVLAQFGTEKIYSHISRRNLASQRVHESCGFCKILPYSVYADGSVLHTADTYRYEKTTL